MKKFILLTLLILPLAASAQILIDPVSNSAADTSDFGVTFGTSEIDYDVDGGGQIKVDRDYLGATGTYGISNDLDFYAGGAYTMESSVEGANDEDDGMILATGLRSKFAQIEELSLYGFGQIQYIAEDYTSNAEARIFETNFGILSHVKLFDPLSFYAGIDFVPISEGEIEVGGLDRDMEREDIFGLRFGADLDMNTWKLRAEYAVISEETFTLGASFKL